MKFSTWLETKAGDVSAWLGGAGDLGTSASAKRILILYLRGDLKSISEEFGTSLSPDQRMLIFKSLLPIFGKPGQLASYSTDNINKAIDQNPQYLAGIQQKLVPLLKSFAQKPFNVSDYLEVVPRQDIPGAVVPKNLPFSNYSFESAGIRDRRTGKYLTPQEAEKLKQQIRGGRG
jgi:hypothetical protein